MTKPDATAEGGALGVLRTTLRRALLGTDRLDAIGTTGDDKERADADGELISHELGVCTGGHPRAAMLESEMASSCKGCGDGLDATGTIGYDNEQVDGSASTRARLARTGAELVTEIAEHSA